MTLGALSVICRRRSSIVERGARIAVVTALTLLGADLTSREASANAGNRCPVVVDTVFVARTDASTRRVLRDSVEEEVAKLDFGTKPYAQRYVLSASLLTLNHIVEKDAEKTTCVVGLALRDANDNLVASIQGRATAEAGRGAATAADAVRSAAHSAVSRVVAAVRASERAGNRHQ